MIAHDDRGLLLGDGLFETLLARDGELVDLAAHLDRLAAGCAVLGLPAPDRAEAEAVMRAALVETGAARAAVRLTLTAGSGGRGLDRPQQVAPRMFATASASAQVTTPARLASVGICRNEGSPASRLKTLAYLDNVLARAAARAAGADEALMLNNAGEIAGGAAANIFWIADGRLFTPALECGVLDGIARARVLAAAAALGVDAAQIRSPQSALGRAQAIFLTNSLIGVRAVADLDGVPFVANRLVEALARTVSPT